MNTDDYLQGMRDCKDGIPHQPGKSQDYNDGYSCQYSSEAVQGWANDEMGLEVDCGFK